MRLTCNGRRYRADARVFRHRKARRREAKVKRRVVWEQTDRLTIGEKSRVSMLRGLGGGDDVVRRRS